MVCLPQSPTFESSCQPFLEANLARTVPVAFEESTPYTDPNEALANELWDRINIDAGMVALPADFATANGLPLAQRFPWDPSKGIYLLNGYHNLHCIVRKRLPFPSTSTVPNSFLGSKAKLTAHPSEQSTSRSKNSSKACRKRGPGAT